MAKSAAQVAAKFARVTPQRSEDYIEGVNNPRRSWEAATKGAEDNYKAGVTKAANEGRFGRGVSAAGDAKWQANTVAKGQTRWGEGVSIAQGDYERAMGPVLATIERTTLPPRYPKGDPRNIKRVEAMATALHKLKTGR